MTTARLRPAVDVAGVRSEPSTPVLVSGMIVVFACSTWRPSHATIEWRSGIRVCLKNRCLSDTGAVIRKIKIPRSSHVLMFIHHCHC